MEKRDITEKKLTYGEAIVFIHNFFKDMNFNERLEHANEMNMNVNQLYAVVNGKNLPGSTKKIMAHILTKKGLNTHENDIKIMKETSFLVTEECLTIINDNNLSNIDGQSYV